MSKGKKVLREAFRNAVFARDGYNCVICKRSAVDAHHIVNRNAIDNGGYVAYNGVSLCSQCHLAAEKGEINERELLDKINP